MIKITVETFEEPDLMLTNKKTIRFSNVDLLKLTKEQSKSIDMINFYFERLIMSGLLKECNNETNEN